MKCAILTAVTAHSASASLSALQNHHHALRSVALQQTQEKQIAKVPKDDDGYEGFEHYGDVACPCIGFDNVDGKTKVDLGNGKHMNYPADVGSRCEAWDNGRYPKACKEGGDPGFGEEWCGQQWCFVDACNCKLENLPKLSVYLPDTLYRGRPIFYSYETCGAKDYFSEEGRSVGKPGCQCIGFQDNPGTLEYAGVGTYPADTGGTCSAWDNRRHPDCEGEGAPRWCREKWCYVDPCDCDLTGTAIPKVSSYLPDSRFGGRPIFYSYETCGGVDVWTAGNKDACVNQDNKADCLDMPDKCGWTGDSCVGKELANPNFCQHKGTAYQKRRPKKAERNQARSRTSGLLSLLAVPVVLRIFAAQ